MKIPKAVTKLSESFERLPGIGPKTAQRLAFYLLHVPQHELDSFSKNLLDLKENTQFCSICFHIGDSEICPVCDDSARKSQTICVVEDPLDVIAVERGRKFDGVYHVLHGVIDPLNSIGPDDIYIPQLLTRVREHETGVEELILATNPTMEGEATAMYIAKEIEKIGSDIRVTRIGRGLPIGADIEYADEITIERALEGRREY